MRLKPGLGKRLCLGAATVSAVIVPALLSVFHAAAQPEDARALPRFEVATVKPVVTEGGMIMMRLDVYPGGRIRINGWTVKALVAAAFHLPYREISGGDAWTASDKPQDLYYVEAKPPESMQSSIKDLRHTLFDIEDIHVRQMLQALLIDRFQLKYHRETKTGDVYLLKRSDKPLLLEPVESPDASPYGEGFGQVGYAGGCWRIYRTSMPQLAKFASDRVGAPVLDRTELQGQFDYRQRVPDYEPAYAGDAHTDSFMNLLRTVGLKLERSKGPIETLVIDKAERPSPD